MTDETPRDDAPSRGRRHRGTPAPDETGPTGILPFADDQTAEFQAVPASVPSAVALADDPATEVLEPVDPDATTVLERITDDTPRPAQLPPIDPRARIAERRAKEKKQRRRIVRRGLLATLVAIMLVVGYSVGHALSRQTSASTTAKLAEWGRDHHLGWAVTDLEKLQYKLHPPRTGGKLAGGIQVGTGTAPVKPSVSPKPVKLVPPHTTAPTNLAPIVKDGAYPDEGVWKPLVTGSDALPLVLGTAIRPDTVHTSYQIGIAWMDPKRVSFQLHPGAGEPAGTWSTSSTLGTPALQKGLVAAFNAGFRLPGGQSRGGWYLDGTWVYPARVGAESFVIYKNGTAKVGTWGSDIKPNAQIAAVRQNLDPLLLPTAGGGVEINPSVDENNTLTWGFTLGAVKYIQRSAVGVTKSGAIVYAAGLTDTRTLANVMRTAGCVRAMELDINPEWTIFDYFDQPGGITTATSTGPLTSHALTPGQSASPDHFFVTSSRDFFSVHAR